MVSKTRDRGARLRIRDYLVANGPVEDSSGLATAVLKDAVGYNGSQVGFIQLVAAMDRDGELTREIKGKRTFKITAAAAAPARAMTDTAPPAVPLDLDYDKLAQALLREVARAIAGQPSIPETSDDAARLRTERDDYAARLEEARTQMGVILSEYMSRPADAIESQATPTATEQAS
jgi:hypothetical protein